MTIDPATYGERCKKLWTCTVCGHKGFWNSAASDWSWYGSLRDADIGEIKVVTCSEKCRRKAKVI